MALTTSSTFAQIVAEINNLSTNAFTDEYKRDLVNVLNNSGIQASTSDTFTQLINKINQMEVRIIGQGSQVAKYYETIQKGELVTVRKYFGFDTPIKQSQPSVIPTGGGACVSVSKDGVYVAVGHYNSPYITIYKRDGGILTKLSNPGSLPTGRVISLSFSPDGIYLSVGFDGTAGYPRWMMYKRNGDTFNKITVPNVLNTPYGTKFTPDGNYVLVSCTGSGDIFLMFKREGDTFTSVYQAGTSTGSSYGVDVSTDGVYVAGGSPYGKYVVLFKKNGDTLTKLPDPDIAPTGSANDVAFSPDGNYLAVASNTLVLYKRNGDSFTKLPNPDIMPPNTTRSVAFSPDGVYLAVGHYGVPYLTIYKRNGDIFTKVAGPSSPPDNRVDGIAYLIQEPYLYTSAITQLGSIEIYKSDILGDFAHKYTGLVDFDLPNYLSFGYTKSAGTVNSENEVITLPIKQ